jgi:two-component system, sensor histidine kinase LadS
MKIVYNENLNKSELDKLFVDDNKCLDFLAQLKWTNGFICKKCGNDNYCEGKVPFSRRCTRCKNEESATANTMFHNIKFPVNKAFYIAYEVFKNNKLSTFELSQSLNIRQMTCWNFKNKVEDRLNLFARNSGSSDIMVTDIFAKEIESPFK